MNLGVILCLVIQTDEIGINVHNSSSLACIGTLGSLGESLALLLVFSQSHLQSLLYLFRFTIFVSHSFRPFFMSMHMGKAKCVPGVSYTIQ